QNQTTNTSLHDALPISKNQERNRECNNRPLRAGVEKEAWQRRLRIHDPASGSAIVEEILQPNVDRTELEYHEGHDQQDARHLVRSEEHTSELQSHLNLV